MNSVRERTSFVCHSCVIRGCAGGSPARAWRRGGSVLLDFAVAHVSAPAFDEGGHVGGEGRVEVHPLPRGGMLEAERLGVEGLPGTGGETVLHELLVFREGGAFQDGVAAVFGVVE